MAASPPESRVRPDSTNIFDRTTILSVSRKTRLLIERNQTLALLGFRVVSPRSPEEAPVLAVQQNVDAVVIGHSVEAARRAILIDAIRRACPHCVIVFAYIRPNGPDEPLADVAVDVTDGPETLATELRSRLPQVRSAASSLLYSLVRSAIEATAADFGNVQLFDTSTSSLRIAAQYGFNEDFLRFFALVHGSDTACGSALGSGSRIVVEDVASDPIFQNKPSGEMMLRANSYAVQSTPLIAASGRLIGIVSTHFRKPTTLRNSRFLALDRVTNDFIARLESAAVTTWR